MIGGNKILRLQKRSVIKNKIGEQVSTWTDYIEVTGWLDLQSGDSKNSDFNSKIQESTHVFVADYKPLGNVTAETSRAIIDGGVYDVTLIDNPMELNRHLEIYLKYTGGQ